MVRIPYKFLVCNFQLYSHKIWTLYYITTTSDFTSAKVPSTTINGSLCILTNPRLAPTQWRSAIFCTWSTSSIPLAFQSLDFTINDAFHQSTTVSTSCDAGYYQVLSQSASAAITNNHPIILQRSLCYCHSFKRFHCSETWKIMQLNRRNAKIFSGLGFRV